MLDLTRRVTQMEISLQARNDGTGSTFSSLFCHPELVEGSRRRRLFDLGSTPLQVPTLSPNPALMRMAGNRGKDHCNVDHIHVMMGS